MWTNPLFKQLALIVLVFLGSVGILLFPFRKKNTHLAAAWASLQSWLFFTPVLFLMLAAGDPWPLVGITLVSLLCIKEFFQLTGMYHRSFFVWITYISGLALAFSIYYDYPMIYNLMPMIFLGTISLIPIAKNEAKNMLQFIALSLISMIFMGWAFMHIAWIVKLPHGAFYLIYIILLTELCDNVALAVSRLFGKKKIVDQITPKRTLEGLIISFGITLVAAYGLRIILPPESQNNWWVYGLTAALVGSTGDLILAVIRRDLGVKDYGIFILGRGGLLDRMDRLIFVAPIYFYLLLYF